MVSIFNTTIATTDGTFLVKTISLDEAKELVQDGFQSFVGHEATAQIVSTMLDIDCAVNRVFHSQQVGEIALVLKMNGRPTEGKILTLAEMEEIGYTWKKMTRVK